MTDYNKCPICKTISSLEQLMCNDLNCPSCGAGISSKWELR